MNRVSDRLTQCVLGHYPFVLYTVWVYCIIKCVFVFNLLYKSNSEPVWSNFSSSNISASVLGTRGSVVNYSVYFFISDFCQRFFFSCFIFAVAAKPIKVKLVDSHPRVGVFVNGSAESHLHLCPASYLFCRVAKKMWIQAVGEIWLGPTLTQFVRYKRTVGFQSPQLRFI